MASRGQKFQKVKPEIKLEILKKYFDGLGGPKTLEREYGVSFETIKTWIYKSKKEINVAVDHRKGSSGRSKTVILTKEDYKERYEILKKYQAFLEARQGKK